MSRHSTDNTALFQPSGSSPRYREEASRSWWTHAKPEGFTSEAQQEQQRMARSKGAKLAKGLLLGWKVSGRQP